MERENIDSGEEIKAEIDEDEDDPQKRRKVEIDERIRLLIEQHDYIEDIFDEDNLRLVLKSEIDEKNRVEFTLQQAAYALYKHRTCKSDVSPEEWQKLISGRKLSTSSNKEQSNNTK